jgi:hypothetical protein
VAPWRGSPRTNELLDHRSESVPPNIGGSWVGVVIARLTTSARARTPLPPRDNARLPRTHGTPARTDQQARRLPVPLLDEAAGKTPGEPAGSRLRVGSEIGHLTRRGMSVRPDAVAHSRPDTQLCERRAAFRRRLSRQPPTNPGARREPTAYPQTPPSCPERERTTRFRTIVALPVTRERAIRFGPPGSALGPGQAAEIAVGLCGMGSADAGPAGSR